MSEKCEVVVDRFAGRLSGEIDITAAAAAEPDLLATAMRTPGSTVVVDCVGLTFIDSSGVQMLEHVAERSGKRVQLVNLDRTCRRLFEILGLCATFGIEEIPPEALVPRLPLPA